MSHFCRFGLLVLLAVLAAGCSDPAPSVNQAIAAAVSPRNVTVTWEALPGQEVAIERAPAGGDFVEVARKAGDHARFLDLALQPETQYRYRLRACTGTECGAPAELPPVTTLPSAAPAFTISVPWTGSDDDVLLFGAYKATFDPYAPGQALAVARDGTILWEIDSNVSMYSEIEVLKDGTLALQLAGDLYWHDLDQRVLTHYAQTLMHHDVDQMADGRFIFIAFDPFEYPPGTTRLGDSIRILGHDYTTIDWEWRCRDHIPLTDESQADLAIILWGLGQDWTHANNIVFDEAAGRIYFSVRNLNRLYAIDYPSGDVAWIMGDGGDFGGGIWDHAHGFEFTAPNRLVLLDNGTNRPGSGPKYSRVIEVEFDPDAKTAEVVWEYRETPDFYSPFLGSVQPQANGDVLVTDGTNGRLFQVARDGTITWELRLDLGIWTYKGLSAPRALFTEW